MKNLMIIDMQKGLMNKNNDFLINKINNLLKSEKFDNVIYTEFYNKSNSQFVRFLNWNDMQLEDEISFSVKLLGNAIIFSKMSYGISEEQIKILKNKNISEIYLCGTDIDACVLAIGFNLFDNGIRPIFLIDYCASANEDSGIKNLIKKIVLRNFGKESLIEG